MNTCKFCGTQLNGTETVCPNCGNPVSDMNVNITQPAMPAGMVEQPVAPVQPNMMNNMNQVGNPVTPGVIQQQAPAENMVNPQPIPNPAPVNTNAPIQQIVDSNTPKKKNTTIILVIVLMVVLAIASLVFGVVLLNKESDGKKETKKEEKPSTEVSTNTTQNVDFAGYTFTIPGDYTYKVDSGFLMIMDNAKTSAYIICFDYTHTYQEYKNYIAATYPAIYPDTIVNVNNREYMVVNYHNDAENYWLGTFYSTIPNGSVVYSGTVEHANGTAISLEDMQFIEELITNATSVNTFAAGNEYDLGTKGAVDFILNPYKVDFNSNLTNDGTDTNTTPEDENTTNNVDNPEESISTEKPTNSEEG